MIRKLLFIIICFFYLANATGQILCEPFYAIGQSNNGKVWKAIFKGCIDFQSPIIKSVENPLIRAQVVSKFKIRKITSKESKNSLPETEYFDSKGYTIFVGNDTTNGLYYLNLFNENDILSSIIYKSGYSISGIKNEHSDTLHTVEKFIYDDFDKLIQKKEITTSLIKNFFCGFDKRSKDAYFKKPRSSRFTKTIKYDVKNNIIALKTSDGSSDVFTYDSETRLLLQLT